jgi:hypothetical protein
LLTLPHRTEVTTMAHPSALEGERPDPKVFWRWVWLSVRPVLGYVFIALGLVGLLTAYFGVSREVLVAKQLPYLVSGGLFGLAAVTLGSRLLLLEDLRRDAGRLDRLERAVLDLHQALLTRPDAPQPGVNGVARSSAPEQLLALVGGTSFHRADCPIVAGKDTARPLTTAAQRKGLQPCAMCQPLAAGV